VLLTADPPVVIFRMRAASEPRRCALVPQKAIIADGMKMAPDCMHVVDLPFCDDIRQPPPNVTNYTVPPPKDAVEVRVPRSHSSPPVPPPLRTVGFNIEGALAQILKNVVKSVYPVSVTFVLDLCDVILALRTTLAAARRLSDWPCIKAQAARKVIRHQKVAITPLDYPSPVYSRYVATVEAVALGKPIDQDEVGVSQLESLLFFTLSLESLLFFTLSCTRPFKLVASP